MLGVVPRGARHGPSRRSALTLLFIQQEIIYHCFSRYFGIDKPSTDDLDIGCHRNLGVNPVWDALQLFIALAFLRRWTARPPAMAPTGSFSCHMVCLGWLPEILTEGFAMPLNQLEFPFEDTRLFPVKDTCKHLGISRRTLERLVATGDFPLPIKIGRKSLFTSSDLKIFVVKLTHKRDLQRCNSTEERGT